MARANLRLIAGRPVQVPTLTQEYRTESLWALVKRGLYSFTEAVFGAIAVLAVTWAVAVLLLSLELVR